MQRCHPGQMPSGTAPSAASALQGLQRQGIGLVAVCAEIHDRERYSGKQATAQDIEYVRDG